MIQALIQSSLFDCAMDRPAFGKVFQADDNVAHRYALFLCSLDVEI